MDRMTSRIGGAVLVLLMTSPALLAASGSSGQSNRPAHQERSTQSKEQISKPRDCEDIGPGTGGGSTEAAAKQECKRSRHLGGDLGTSSGTGTGTMGPGEGPR